MPSSVAAALTYLTVNNVRIYFGNQRKLKNIFTLLIMITVTAFYLYDITPSYAARDMTEADNFASDTEPSVDPEELMRLGRKCEEDHASFKRTQYEATRRCGVDGYWLDRYNQSSSIGWTDFIKCFPPYMQDLLENASKSADSFFSKFKIAVWTRIGEFTGLGISSISLIVSICVFTIHKKLLNSRTRVHRHLFCVILALSITTISIYSDQLKLKLLTQCNVACILTYTLYELLTSISFAFMLIEGLTLYRIVSANALRPQISYRVLIISGYVYPTLNTIIWFVTAGFRYDWKGNSCWFGYNLDTLYWILQGPRLMIIMTNFTVMLFVVKAVLKKQARSDVTETQQIKTAVRVTIFLMPLLGITNFISMMNPPLKDTTSAFAVWAFFAYFFKSLQGFFVSVIYCFKNSEVLEVLCRRKPETNNGRVAHTVRFRANITDSEIVHREEESKRLELPDVELGVVDFNEPTPTTSHVVEIDEHETGQIEHVVVHRCETPPEVPIELAED